MRGKKYPSYNTGVSTLLVAGPLPAELASKNELSKIFPTSEGILSVSIYEDKRGEALIKYAHITVKNYLVAAEVIKRKHGQRFHGVIMNVYIKPPKKVPRISKKEYQASKYTLYKPNPNFKLRQMPGSHGRQ